MAQNGVNNSNNQVVISILDEIQTQGNRIKQDCENRRIIRRIPPLLRRNEFYDPKIVSIGPYHHGKPDLQMADKFKPRVAQLLFPNRQHIDTLYQEVLLMVPELRSCYEPEPELTQKLNDPQFAQMMFLDCCLLLALLEPFFPNSPFRAGQPMVIFNFNLSFSSMSYESFFLLENQLPFAVLTLVAARLLSVDHQTATNRIAQAVQAMPGLVLHNRVTNPTPEEEEPPPVHLFELHYRKVLSNPSTKLHGAADNEMRVDIADLVVTYRSATDLKCRGIHFQRRQSGLLGDVKFTSYLFSGKLEISPFFISSNFEIIVSNATAYEQSPYGPPMKPRLISFFTFLRSLIDSPEDVKELRSKRIINTLGMSDEHVARLFQKMNVGKDDPNMYYAVRKSIDQHYNNWMKTSMAQLRRAYFNSPWAFIVFLAAATGLAMAIVQAYYNIHPVSK